MVKTGIDKASSLDEAWVLLEKRKHIDPPDEWANRDGPYKKKKKKKNAKKAGKPTVETRVVVEDMNKNSFSSSETAYSGVPLNQSGPGIILQETQPA